VRNRFSLRNGFLTRSRHLSATAARASLSSTAIRPTSLALRRGLLTFLSSGGWMLLVTLAKAAPGLSRAAWGVSWLAPTAPGGRPLLAEGWSGVATRGAR
jgi:hypothetical protein